jgi:Divergent InlB B-repeat domain
VLAGAWAAPGQAAPWCGTPAPADRPQAVAGPFVHVVYAFPSDGADRSAELATQISADVDEIDAWWRGQDPTRAPRFDVFPYACGPQADLSAVRLPQSGAQLASIQGRAAQASAALAAVGLSSSFGKYLVYYDGPSNDANICGQSSLGPLSGPTYAFVYLTSCSGVPTSAVAAHELIHALGALPPGAPHACRNDSGHPCDSQADILYPFASGQPLLAHLLDVGRDDYYGHAGGWFDLQDSSWLRRLDAPQVPLAVAVTGGGTVRSLQPGPDCAATCTVEWDAGSTVQLDPVPATGQRFLRWNGSCVGQTCTLQMTAPQAVTAVFGPARFALSVGVTGRGVVRSTPAGLACRIRCSARFTSFQAVRLTATAQRGWRFRNWAGACAGARRTCSVPMRAATQVRAVFIRRR